MITYKEIILKSNEYKNRRGEAEKIVLDKWISKTLDVVFKNNVVPFQKPIYELIQNYNIRSWSDLILRLNKNQENYQIFKKTLPEKCPLCGALIGNERTYNYTIVAGCMQYEYGKCNYSQTYYSDIVFYRLEILEESLSFSERNNMLEQIKKYGVNGLPDFIGLKNGVLHLIEAKDIIEKLFEKQHDWLNWFALNTKAQALLIRVKS